jgi:hypothetical protein
MLILLSCATTPEIGLLPERAPFPVDPGFSGEVSIRGANVAYYEVAGRDDAEVLLALRATPRFGAGAHAATTDWAVRWERPDGGVCTAADVRVFVELTVHVPRWRAPPDAPAASVGNWQRYVRALSEHEQGHVDRILAIVARMPEVLAEQGCDGVDVRGREALDVIREANAAYDEATGSGALQGAVLFLPRG